MSWALLILVLLVVCGTFSGLSLILLAVSSYLLLNSFQINLGFQQHLALFLLVISAPMIAYLANKFIAAFLGKTIPGLEQVCFCLSLLLVFNSDFVPQLTAVLVALPDQANCMLLNLKLISVVLQCACIISFALCATCLAFELPLHWLKAAQVTRADLGLNGLRPLLLVFIASVSFNLIVGLIHVELRKISVF